MIRTLIKYRVNGAKATEKVIKASGQAGKQASRQAGFRASGHVGRINHFVGGFQGAGPKLSMPG